MNPFSRDKTPGEHSLSESTSKKKGESTPENFPDDNSTLKKKGRNGAVFTQGVLFHKGISWAVGLEWYVPEESNAYFKLRSYMKEMGHDLYCVRKGNDKQFGLGARHLGHKSGLPSLASVLADKITAQSWHGIFEATNGYLHIKVRELSIVPEGDLFFKTKEEALASFDKENADDIWWKRFVPASWGIEQTEELSLDEVLDKFDYNGKLISPTKIQNLIIAGGILAIGAFFAPSAIDLLKDQLWEPQQVEKAPTPASSKREIIKLTRTGTLLDPVSFLGICVKSAEAHYRGIPGWKPQSVTCVKTKSKGQLIIDWSQSGGSVKDLLEQVLTLAPSATPLVGTGQRFSVSINLDGFTKQQDQELYDEANALFEAHRRLYGLGTREVSVKAAKSVSKNIDSRHVLNSRQMPVYFVSRYAIENISQAFSIPGLEIEKATWTPANNEWAIKARLYVR